MAESSHSASPGSAPPAPPASPAPADATAPAAASDRQVRARRGPFGTDLPPEGAARVPWIRRVFRWLGLGAIVLGAGWFYAAPYFTLQRVQSAAAAGDAAALARDVDEDALRTSLRNALAERLVVRHAGTSRDSSLTAAAAAMAGGFVGTTVDRLVSPAGLDELLQGRFTAPLPMPDLSGTVSAGAASLSSGLEQLKAAATAWLPSWPRVAASAPAPPSAPVSPPSPPSQASSMPAPPTAPADRTATLDRSYEDLDRFTAIARHPDRPDQPVTLVFSRHHIFWWKLTGARLPG